MRRPNPCAHGRGACVGPGRRCHRRLCAIPFSLPLSTPSARRQLRPWRPHGGRRRWHWRRRRRRRDRAVRGIPPLPPPVRPLPPCPTRGASAPRVPSAALLRPRAASDVCRLRVGSRGGCVLPLPPTLHLTFRAAVCAAVWVVGRGGRNGAPPPLYPFLSSPPPGAFPLTPSPPLGGCPWLFSLFCRHTTPPGRPVLLLPTRRGRWRPRRAAAHS